MQPLYLARIEDLGRGDLVQVDCAACHDVALLTPDPLKAFVVVAGANFAAVALSALSRSRSRRPERRLLQRLLPAAGSGPSAPPESAARSRRRPHPRPTS